MSNVSNIMNCQRSWNVKGRQMANVILWQMSSNAKCHLSTNFVIFWAFFCHLFGNFWYLLPILAAFTIFWHLFGIFYNCWHFLPSFSHLWQLLPSFGNFWQILQSFGFSLDFFLTIFGIVWQLFVSCGNLL